MTNSSSHAKSATWARTLFSGSGTNPNAVPVVSSHSSSSDRDQHDINVPESPNSTFNQQATNAVLSLLNINVCCVVVIACVCYCYFASALSDCLLY